MSPRDYAALVRKMRVAQKRYFEAKLPATLRLARDLERRVDKATADILNGQGRLLETWGDRMVAETEPVAHRRDDER